MSTKKWGIIGLGKISNKFAQALAIVEGAEIYAVASRTLTKAQDFAKAHQAKVAYGSYDALFQDENIDVVYIGTPHTSHTALAMRAMNHGKAVLCEKPIAMNAKQAQQMFDCAKKNKVFLMEALWTRFIPSYQKAKTLIEEGAIGEVKYIYADFGFKGTFDPQSRLYNKKLGGGSILDVGIYPVFLTTNLLGKPNKIQATAKLSEQGIDLTCGMMLQYDNAIALLSSSVEVNQNVMASIHGTEGTLRLNNRFHEPTSISILKKYEEIERFEFEESGNGMQYQAIEVQKMLEAGKTQSDKMSWSDSLLLHEVMDEVRQQVGVVYDFDL